MSYKSLEHYLSRGPRGTLDAALQRAERIGADDINPDTYSHKAAILAQQFAFTPYMKSKCSLLYINIDLASFMRILEKKNDYQTKDYFDNCVTTQYNYHAGEFTLHTKHMIRNICSLMNKRKIIFLQFTVDNYIVTELTNDQEYTAHSTCAILVPTKKLTGDGYCCYYINSHGRDIKDNHLFEYIITRKRKKVIKLAEPTDVVFMKSFIRHINYRADTPIQYDGTSKYTYRGANLQAGDCHGECFIYPLIIWYYFGQFYNKFHTLVTEFGNVDIRSGKQLLFEGHLNYFIESIFWPFCPKHHEILVHQYNMGTSYSKITKVTEKYIEKEAFRFVKMLIGPFISYIQQIIFKLRII